MKNSDFKLIYENPTIDDLSVGQVWKCLEDSKIVLISLVRELPDMIKGHIFTGFEVGEYISYSVSDFIKYFRCIYDPRK